MYAAILTGSIIAFLLYVLIENKKDPKRIVGIYYLPGKWYWLKYSLMRTVLFLRRLNYYALGKEFFHTPMKFDKLQKLSDHPLGFDAVFFHAISQDGVYFCAGTERRHNNKVNGLVYLLIPGVGLLLSEKLPNTVLEADPSPTDFAAEGIRLTPLVPMKKWRVVFKGKMRFHDDPKKVVNVELEAIWHSDSPWFLFDVDLPASCLARGIAKQQWNKELFQSLKEAHQVHYEQMGIMEGSVKIDSKEHPLKLDAFRDHSFGKKRDWSLMHRYIYHVLSLSDQTRISLGIVSQPSTSAHLEMGYVVKSDKTIHTIDECDIVLYQHGENGVPSEELTFTFKAGGDHYEVTVKYDITVVHYVGENTLAKMVERFCSCTVNGVKGTGISEWHYNNKTFSNK